MEHIDVEAGGSLHSEEEEGSSDACFLVPNCSLLAAYHCCPRQAAAAHYSRFVMVEGGAHMGSGEGGRQRKGGAVVGAGNTHHSRVVADACLGDNHIVAASVDNMQPLHPHLDPYLHQS